MMKSRMRPREAGASTGYQSPMAGLLAGSSTRCLQPGLPSLVASFLQHHGDALSSSNPVGAISGVVRPPCLGSNVILRHRDAPVVSTGRKALAGFFFGPDIFCYCKIFTFSPSQIHQHGHYRRCSGQH